MLLSFSDSLSGLFFALLGVYLFFASSATKLHFFLGVFLHFITGADTMREGDYGLFISLSGYTKNARKYLDSTPIIRGIDGDELVTLVLKYYENLSPKYKKVIPLERIYIPVPVDE